MTGAACEYTTTLFWSEAPLKHASVLQVKPPRHDGQSSEDAASRVQSIDEHIERLHDVAVEVSFLLEFVSLNMRVRWQLLLYVADAQEVPTVAKSTIEVAGSSLSVCAELHVPRGQDMALSECQNTVAISASCRCLSGHTHNT